MAESKDDGSQRFGKVRSSYSGVLEETSYKSDALRTSKEIEEGRRFVSDIMSDNKTINRGNDMKITSNGETKQQLLCGESKSQRNSSDKQIEPLRQSLQYSDNESDSKDSSDIEENENKYAVGISTITDDDFTPDINMENFSRGFRM